MNLEKRVFECFGDTKGRIQYFGHFCPARKTTLKGQNIPCILYQPCSFSPDKSNSSKFPLAHYIRLRTRHNSFYTKIQKFTTFCGIKRNSKFLHKISKSFPQKPNWKGFWMGNENLLSFPTRSKKFKSSQNFDFPTKPTYYDLEKFNFEVLVKF